MSETLIEKVARAIMDITSCDLHTSPGRCLVDRAGSCYCREEARAAIAVVIEEAAHYVDNLCVPEEPMSPIMIANRDMLIADAIRRLAE
jgi:hypothetical protein